MQQFSGLLYWRLFTAQQCFGRFPAHHQELNDCSGSLWFYLRIVAIGVLCSWSGQLLIATFCQWFGDVLFGNILSVFFNGALTYAVRSVGKAMNEWVDGVWSILGCSWGRKTEVLGEQLVPVPTCPLYIPYGMAWDCIRSSRASGRLQTA